MCCRVSVLRVVRGAMCGGRGAARAWRAQIEDTATAGTTIEDGGHETKEGPVTDLWRLNRRTRPHNPGPARKEGAGYCPAPQLNLGVAPQVSGSAIAVAIKTRVQTGESLDERRLNCPVSL
jgi:hypothetical protein